MTEEQKMQFLIALAKSGANISQVNMGDGTQNFYLGGKEQEHPVFDSAEIVDVVDDANTNTVQPDELSPSRQEILERLLHYVTKGDWIAPATIVGIQNYLKTGINDDYARRDFNTLLEHCIFSEEDGYFRWPETEVYPGIGMFDPSGMREKGVLETDSKGVITLLLR